MRAVTVSKSGRDVLTTGGIALSVVAGGAVAVLGLSGSSATLTLGALFPGFIALASGAMLAWGSSARWGSRGPAQARYRQLLGAALLVWSVGQLWNGVAVAVGTPVFPTPGDLISFFAAPLAVAGLLAVPRSTSGTHPAWRLGLDSILFGVTLALPCWLFFFSRIFAGPFGGSDLAAVLVLVADVTVVCVSALAFVRDLDRALLLASLGAACYSVGDLINMHATLEHPGQWPWPGAVLWCLAWPLIAAGLLRYQPAVIGPAVIGSERNRPPVDPDARGVLITTTASLVLLMVSLVTLVVRDHSDRVAIALVAVAVAVFWAREVLNARFRSQLLRQLHAEATADPLTGLANRRVLAAHMSSLPQGEPWCLLTVDLDGFKDVNDLLGHATGDRLLAAVAGRLKTAVPADALVSRIGGDEFAVLLPGDIEVGTRVGQQIITAVRQSAADVEGVARVEVSASVGVAAVHAGGPPTDQLIDLTDAGLAADAALASSKELLVVPSEIALNGNSNGNGSHSSAVNGTALNSTALNGHVAEVEAIEVIELDAVAVELISPPTVVDPLGALSASGAALRVAKAGGRNRVEVYDVEVARIRQRRLRVEERLRSAVESGAITVMFQPIVDLRRGVMAGAEALARWNDPELGRVNPEEFITVAEQTGLVVAIGEQILNATLSGGVKEGLFDRGLRLSVNVSPVQLRVPGFQQVVQEAIAAHGVPRQQVVIEVTEQVLVEEGQAAQTLHRLAALGITIAIDDFGTGYSALGYLQRLPADILKIDRSLTSSLIAEPRSRAITRAVLDLGRTVGVSVVVEGVETSQVDDLVRRMGVGFGQGLHYGAAMTGRELAIMADRLSAARTAGA
jgi:diguanylate cyclase (GGDEF)-like protein